VGECRTIEGDASGGGHAGARYTESYLPLISVTLICAGALVNSCSRITTSTFSDQLSDRRARAGATAHHSTPFTPMMTCSTWSMHWWPSQQLGWSLGEEAA